MKSYFSLFAMVLIGLSNMTAQQDSHYTQYLYNTEIINPAYISSKSVYNVTLLNRTQWVGFEGAPSTQTLSFYGPVFNKMNFGASLINDKIGALNNLVLTTDWAYQVRLNNNYKLALGLKVGGYSYQLDTSLLRVDNESDDYLNNLETSSSFTPILGTGLYLYNDNSYLGFSIPSFFENQHIPNEDSVRFNQHVNMFLMGGYIFEINRYFKLKPSLLLKYIKSIPLQADFSINSLIKDKFIFGLAYRTSQAISGHFALRFKEKFLVGYTYDYDMNGIQNVSGGSHEIFLNVAFESGYKRFVSPRFF